MIKILIIAIFILASFLRLWNLNNFPAGFNADEAAIGYNAYSILQTGKDEYGETLPLAFKSFGDYKPGLYFYLVIPFVATLGLNEWSVRLPSALLGIGTVILIFLLGKEIFNKKVGLLSSLLLAISPWHVHFSRGAWETNVATFFITLGIWFFIKGLSSKKMIFWSMVSFLASMHTYQSPRLIVPVLLSILVILYRKQFISILFSIKEKITKSVLPLLILLILSVPIGLQFISGQGGARFSGLSFLSDAGPVSRVNELRGEHENPSSIFTKLIHNKFTAYGSSFLGHYLDHFKPDFLFINGDPLIRNKVPETGQFYLIEALFLSVGLISLAKNKIPHTKLLITWVLVAPLASAMTYQTPHALRALNMVIPLTLIIAYGLFVFTNLLKKDLKPLVLTIITAIFIFECLHYIESYYIHAPKRYSLAWEYGFKEMVSKLEKYESNYDKVVITDRYDQPYILVLFYKKYDPSKYQPQAKLTERDKFNFGTVRNFDKYHFRNINPVELNEMNTLYIGTDQEIPKDVNILDVVNFKNGQPAFIFTEGK